MSKMKQVQQAIRRYNANRDAFYTWQEGDAEADLKPLGDAYHKAEDHLWDLANALSRDVDAPIRGVRVGRHVAILITDEREDLDRILFTFNLDDVVDLRQSVPVN